MDLDQAVVRSSFRHYGVQPQFDNEKVQWWFGDASKSLTLLSPEQYFGTFDLVIIDLLSFIFDVLRVGDEMLVDYLMRFVKPNGVLVRQEDFVERHVLDFAKYTVEFDVHDLPYSCVQSFTMGSNGIDFSKKAPIDHQVETIYYDSHVKNLTSIWSNYRTNRVPHTRNKRRKMDNTVDTSSLPTEESVEAKRYGILAVLEVEEIPNSLQELSMVMARIREVLKQAGLTVIQTIEEPSSSQRSPHTLVFLLNEGYVVARSWPEHNYCAFDVQFWNDISRQERTMAGLVSAVGGDMENSTSSYRILTGGMFGVGVDGDGKRALKTASNPLWKTHNDTSLGSSRGQEFDVILQELLALVEAPEPSLVVVCGEQAWACESLELVKKKLPSSHIVPLWACPSLVNNDTAIGVEQWPDSTRLVDCERDLRSLLINSFGADGNKRVDGILIDPSTTLEMGQLVHKLFNNTRLRHELLLDDFIILSPAVEGRHRRWKHALLERFRTEIVHFNPVFHAHVAFYNDETETRFEIGVFSAGDSDFYRHLMDASTRVREKTELTHEILESRVGLKIHIPDYEPAILPVNEYYDLQPSLEQWHGQHPLGNQAILQYEIQKPHQAIFAGARVLVNGLVHAWEGRWYSGRVLNRMENGLYRIELDSGERVKAARDLLVERNEHSEESPLEFGDLILGIDPMPLSKETFWYQGSVVKVNPDGTYKLQMFGSFADVVVRERSDLILLAEKQDDKSPDTPAFSSNDFIQIMTEAVNALHFDNDNIAVNHVGDGCVIVSLFTGGRVVAVWDGRIHLEVNISLEYDTQRKEPDDSAAQIVHKVLTKKLPGLSRVQYDEQPRGFGRVVNSRRDLESMWFGQFL